MKPTDELKECLLAQILDKILQLQENLDTYPWYKERAEKLNQLFDIILFDKPCEVGLKQLLIDYGFYNENSPTLYINLSDKSRNYDRVIGRKNLDTMLRREINLRLLQVN